MAENEERTYQNAEDESYLLLFKYIEDELMAQPDIISLMTLTQKLKWFMSEKGIKDVRDSTTRHI